MIVTVLMFTLFLTTCCGTKYKVTDQVYLDIEAENKYLGRIVIGLFGDTAPKTVKNFLTIAAIGVEDKTYTGSNFHRVINRFMIQGGDIVNQDGTGSISIYGESFEDENFEVNHNGAGFVSMANKGPNSNGCQFFITTVAAPWLNGKHTVFGKVIDGEEVVRIIERMKTDPEDRPVKPVIIKKSGVIDTPEYFYVDDEPYSILKLIKAGLVPLGFAFAILSFFQYVIHKLRKYENLKIHAM